jgi:soluble lytic murein transglycosylase-like protein
VARGLARRVRLVASILVLSTLAPRPGFTSETIATTVVPRTPVVSCEREIAAAALRYDIPLAVFYAVGLNETGAKGRLQPFAMNIDGRPSINATLEGALRAFQTAKAGGARMIDIGCMQINHHYHAANFPSLAAMFDPAMNIDYAARFLRTLKEREKTWTMAVARYNAGPDNDPAQKKYVCAVVGKMVASGFGAWTDKARAFCQPTTAVVTAK